MEQDAIQNMNGTNNILKTIGFIPLLLLLLSIDINNNQQTVICAEELKLEQLDAETVRLNEGGKPVWDYVFKQKDHPINDPTDKRKTSGCYFHPLYGFGGSSLTLNASYWDNHSHHHGLWTSFFTVKLYRPDGKIEQYDTWTDNTALKRNFIRWTNKEEAVTGNILGVENGWFLDNGECIMKEEMEVRTSKTCHGEKTGRYRTMDITLTFRPQIGRIELAGDRQLRKGFSSLAIRFLPPREKPLILSDKGEVKNDDMMAKLSWVAYQTNFIPNDKGVIPVQKEWRKPAETAGVAIFPSPKNGSGTDFGWAIRHYGVIASGWPGLGGVILDSGEMPKVLKYRLFIYEKPLTVDELKMFYDLYLQE